MVEQPVLSVIVTVYVPAQSPDLGLAMEPLAQLNEYGDTPPAGKIVICPSQTPLHEALSILSLIIRLPPGLMVKFSVIEQPLKSVIVTV